MKRAKQKPAAPSGPKPIPGWTVHPDRLLIPEMDDKMLAVHIEKIRREGQKFPITVDAEGRVLDGRADLRACLALGLQPKTKIYEGESPTTFMLETMLRTEYNSAQRAVTAARLMEGLEAERVRGSIKYTGRIADYAASCVGVAASSVFQAKTILAEQPDVVGLIDSRKIERFSHANELAKLSAATRARKIARIMDGEDPALVLRPQKINDEWFTPDEILIAVRHLFGEQIGCDPCSDGPKSRVDARVSYAKKQNGLAKKNAWPDPVFINPPFSKKARVHEWIDRAIRETTVPSDKRILMLLPVRPDSAHQERLIKASVNVLFLGSRVAFSGPDSKGDAGRTSTMIVGLNCDTRPLLDFGLEGIVVFAPADRPNDQPHSDYERTPEELEASEPTPAQKADAEALLERQRLDYAQRVSSATQQQAELKKSKL